MIEEDAIFVDSRQRFFRAQGVQLMDPWHSYAQRVIDSTTNEWFYRLGRHRGSRILNAGSGGRNHEIGAAMTHLDLFESNLRDVETGLVANIGDIPVESAYFDVAICVGSVINYADPIRSIKELARVLRVGGLLILEYERSASFEHLWLAKSFPACIRVKSFCGSVETYLWVYGDGFIDGLLTASGLRLLTERRFHALSSIALAFTKSPAVAARFTVGDSVLAQCWPLRFIASNRILALEKFTN
jgi:SAM-dependent methyltransferase